jgi:hypothetical protein
MDEEQEFEAALADEQLLEEEARLERAEEEAQVAHATVGVSPASARIRTGESLQRSGQRARRHRLVV